jgi:hypothetical protein
LAITMRLLFVTLSLLALPVAATAQASGRWPPDSLVNTRVFPRSTPVPEVVGTMRNFTSFLGVRCVFCHVGEEGKPLGQYDFPSDEKRTKLVARQMMRMVEEINRRIDTLPERPDSSLRVTCGTCHHGVSRPVPLSVIVADTAMTRGADSAVEFYRALREKYFGKDAYDFSESSLNIAAFRVGRAGKPDVALALLDFNEGLFPGSSGMYVFRGNIELMRSDTAAAAAAYREAVRRDPANREAQGRLKDIGRQP